MLTNAMTALMLNIIIFSLLFLLIPYNLGKDIERHKRNKKNSAAEFEAEIDKLADKISRRNKHD